MYLCVCLHGTELKTAAIPRCTLYSCSRHLHRLAALPCLALLLLACQLLLGLRACNRTMLRSQPGNTARAAPGRHMYIVSCVLHMRADSYT
jgi:hypothetical protein